MADEAPIPAIYKPFPSFSQFNAGNRTDLSSFDTTANTFQQLKHRVEPDALQRAVDTATRWAAVDTGAIEGLYTVDRGFTLSVAASAAALDNAHLLVGDDVVRAIRDAVNGYDFVLDVATGQRDASETWIRELHAVLCASQGTFRVLTDNGPEERPLVKGAYKELPNSPVNLETGIVHGYALPHDTPAEMARLVEELRSQEFELAHPVLQAAYAHYAFVCVHPFPDGNGRVARALASTYLYRSPGVPLVVFADQKGPYIDALEAADAGDDDPLIAFVRERAIDTMLMVTTDMGRPARPDPLERIGHLNKIMRSDSGLTHTEIDALLARVRTAWEEALDRAASVLQPPLSAHKTNIPGKYEPEDGYRVLAGTHKLQLQIASAAPATGAAYRTYTVQISRPGTDEADYAIFEGRTDSRRSAEKVCDVYLRDVHPTVSQALTYRLDAMAEDALKAMVDEAVTMGEQALKDAGYIV